MVNKQIKVVDKFGENDKECRNCTHFYWCIDCNDYHCEEGIYGDDICKYEPREAEDEINTIN